MGFRFSLFASASLMLFSSVGLAGPAPAPASPPPPASPLPLNLRWCEERAQVEAKAKGFHENLEDVLELAGSLHGQKGQFNLMLEDGVLAGVRFRAFDSDAVFKAIQGGLQGTFGASQEGGSNPVWKSADGTTQVLIKRQSGDLFAIYSTDVALCATAADPAKKGKSAAEKEGPDRRPVFQADKYADDPLENDTRGQEVEEQKKAEEEATKKEEEKKKEEQRKVNIDWDGDQNSTDPKPPSGSSGE